MGEEKRQEGEEQSEEKGKGSAQKLSKLSAYDLWVCHVHVCVSLSINSMSVGLNNKYLLRLELSTFHSSRRDIVWPSHIGRRGVEPWKFHKASGIYGA